MTDAPATFVWDSGALAERELAPHESLLVAIFKRLTSFLEEPDFSLGEQQGGSSQSL